MDSYRKALSFWQQHPAQHRHWAVQAALVLAGLWVVLGWILPRWAEVQQTPAQITQLHEQWQDLSAMAQRLQQQGRVANAGGSNAVVVTDEAMRQRVSQLVGDCAQTKLNGPQLHIEVETCTSAQLVELGQWLDANSPWQTSLVALNMLAPDTDVWQGTWMWQR